jgi:hypothetical protein
MTRTMSIALVAALLAFPATAFAQSPSQVSANDESRSTSSLGGGSGGGGTDPGASSSSGGSADPGSPLAFTGFEAGLVAALGLVLAGAGIALRRSARPAGGTTES